MKVKGRKWSSQPVLLRDRVRLEQKAGFEFGNTEAIIYAPNYTECLLNTKHYAWP